MLLHSDFPFHDLLGPRSSRPASVPSVLANMPPKPKQKAGTEGSSDPWRFVQNRRDRIAFQQDFELLAERQPEESEPSVSAELAAHGYAKLTFQG